MDAFFTWLWSHLATVVGFALGLVLCLRLLRERQRPSVTFAWLLAMFSIPYVGVPLYILFGGRKLRGLRASAERRPTGLERGIEVLLAREDQPAARDGNELAPVQMGKEERGHLVRWPGGWPRLLELDAMRAVRQLQLPQAGAVLEPVAERDPVPCQAEVDRIVVGGDEDARRQRLAERR